MKLTSTVNQLALLMFVQSVLVATGTRVHAQTQNYFGVSGTISGNVWSTNPAGPYNAAFNTTGGGVMNFGNPVTSITGANLTIAGINATANVSGWTASGTLSNLFNGIIPISVASGATLDFGTQAMANNAAAGYTLTGPGILATAGNTYAGGFTINSGTVIVRGTNALGTGGSNTLTINGGTIASNADRNLSAKFPGGIFLNGDVTLGGTTGLASATGILTFENNVNLGAGTRTITIGNNAQHIFNRNAAVISNGGLAIDAVSLATGRIQLLGQNTYAGGTTIKTGAILSTNAISSMGVGPITSGPIGIGTLTFDGGTYIPSSGGLATIANDVVLNNVASNRITNSSTGTNVTVMSGNFTGPGGFTKAGSGILILSGMNSYAGQTNVLEGTLGIAQKNSFHSGVPANWTHANFAVNAGSNLVFAVGGAGEISFAEFMNLTTVGTDSGGFKDLGSIGIDTTNGGDQTISTVLTNTNSGANRLGLVKSGTGTLTLTQENTHGGPTTVAGGTLVVTKLLGLQNSTLTTLAAGTVVFDAAAGGTNFTLGGLAGSGTLALQDSVGTALNVTIGTNGIDAATSAIISGPSGANLIKVGSGVQTLSGANTYDGGTTINAGTLAINNNSAIGSGTLTINNGATLDNTSTAVRTLSANNAQIWNGNFTFLASQPNGTNSGLNLGTGAVTMTTNVEISTPGISNTNNALTVGGVISDGGSNYSLTKTGPGRLVFGGQNTFTGGVTVNSGALHVNDQSSNLGGGMGPLGTGTLTLVGAQLIGTSGAAINTLENDVVLVSDNTLTSNGSMTMSGIISGAGGLMRGGNGSIILSNANTFSGNTSPGDAGGGTRILVLANELAIQNSTLVTSSIGVPVDFDGSVASNSFTLGGLSGDRNIALVNTLSTPIALTIGKNTSDTTYTGNLSGDGSIVKIGTGKSALGGANTYTGTTTINAGTLLVNGTHTGAVGGYTVNSGGTLGGTGDIDGAVSAASGGAIAPGASIESLDVDSLTLASGSLLNFELGAPGVSDLINVMLADSFTANGGAFNFTNAGGMATGSYTLIDYNGVLGGSFANLALGMTQPAGFTYLLVNNAGNTSIDLQITQTTPPGDFNLDGKVNAADYVLWRKNPGGFPPNAYDLWRANFGNPPGAGAGLSEGAVPEPGTGALVILAAVAGWIGRRQRWM